jgi:hypothetical protein
VSEQVKWGKLREGGGGIYLITKLTQIFMASSTSVTRLEGQCLWKCVIFLDRSRTKTQRLVKSL